MVAGAVLPATFTFLYRRADVLLERLAGRGAAAGELTPQDVPDELVGTLTLPLEVNEEALRARAAELEVERFALARYQEDPTLVNPDDQALMGLLGRLREALEDVYGQRFTFRGEQREQSGPLVSLRITGGIGGIVKGMVAQETIRGGATVDAEIDEVRAGGTFVGMQASRIEDRR